MFEEAYKKAAQFTKPIITSFRLASGECKSSIATLTVVNNEGWVLTAFHVIQGFQKLKSSYDEYQRLLAVRTQIEADASMKSGEKQRQLRLNKIPDDAVTNYATFWGWTGVTMRPEIIAIPTVDLALVKLENFNPALVGHYPEFRNPALGVNPGKSLCKLGYPFSSITPIFKEDVQGFELPTGSFPIPLFPIDGIMTREVSIQAPQPDDYPFKFIETSTPGLRGQSGGPTFDINGTVWAIQVQTSHFPLNFGNAEEKGKAAEYLRYQMFNVGWGTHAATIVGFLRENNISFAISS